LLPRDIGEGLTKISLGQSIALSVIHRSSVRACRLSVETTIRPLARKTRLPPLQACFARAQCGSGTESEPARKRKRRGVRSRNSCWARYWSTNCDTCVISVKFSEQSPKLGINRTQGARSANNRGCPDWP
jgi:hypothetical protein